MQTFIWFMDSMIKNALAGVEIIKGGVSLSNNAT
jgi:hypothetical protein